MSYVKLPVSQKVMEEITAALKKADYHHVFGQDGSIKMDGIALVLGKPHEDTWFDADPAKSLLPGYRCKKCGNIQVPSRPGVCSEVQGL